MKTLILVFEVELLFSAYKALKLRNDALLLSSPPLLVFLSLIFSLSHSLPYHRLTHTAHECWRFKYPVKPPVGCRSFMK